MVIEIAVSVIAITLVVMVSFAIPTVIEVRKTAKAAREFFTRTDTELRHVLRDVGAVMTNLRPFTESSAACAEDVKTFMSALGETGRNLHAVNDLLCTVSDSFSRYNVMATGVKASFRYFLEKLKRKGE
ncbi:MAG: DUF948 domain-containing protein [Geobacter sp.]|nr:DUF948 domain-containing protein [Geobacter sp.]